jgi:hypothetical protein
VLVISAYVDYENIGQIHVQRLEKRSKRRKIYTYKVVYPRGYKDVIIKHRYDDGWMILTKKVLTVITRRDK